MNKIVKKTPIFFVKLLQNEVELDNKVSKWTHKELGDYLIQNIWSKEKFGTLNIVVLDRVINILFELYDKK
jgi:hypothetical protein